MKTVNFIGIDCNVVFNHYSLNGMVAIQLFDAKDSSPVATATACLSDYFPPTKNHTLIKDYSENQGILSALEKAGIVKPTGVLIPSGFAQLHEVEILRII